MSGSPTYLTPTYYNRYLNYQNFTQTMIHSKIQLIYVYEIKMYLLSGGTKTIVVIGESGIVEFDMLPNFVYPGKLSQDLSLRPPFA